MEEAIAAGARTLQRGRADIGIDSNILIRHLVQDDPVQSRKATELIEHTLTETNPGFVSTSSWPKLHGCWNGPTTLSDYEIAAALERILQTEVFVVESEAEVFTAMTALKEGRGSFADALIGAIGSQSRLLADLTFDRKALRLPHFQLL